MKKAKVYVYILILALLTISQVSPASAASSWEETGNISGTVQEITLETDPNTGVTTVVVVVFGQRGNSKTVRIGQETAVELGLVTLDEDGNPVINKEALGLEIEIDPSDVIPSEGKIQHPVGSALGTFFSDIPDLDYDTIMSAHASGNGFGVIAQALWLTRKLGGDAEDFTSILEAKKTGDFSAFTLDDGTSPLNWGQFKKAVLSGDKKNNPGVVVSDSNKDGNNGHGNGNNPGNGNPNGTPNNHGNNNKDKDKDNTGTGNGNGNNRP